MFFSVDIVTPTPGTNEPYKFSVPVLRHLLLDCEGSADTLDELTHEVTKVVHKAAEQHIAKGEALEQLDVGLKEFENSLFFPRDKNILLDIPMNDVINQKTAVELPTPFVNAISVFIQENPCFKDVESFIHRAINEKRSRLQSAGYIVHAKQLISEKVRTEPSEALLQYIVFLYTNGKQATKPSGAKLLINAGDRVIGAIKLLVEAHGSTEVLKEFYELIIEKKNFSDELLKLSANNYELHNCSS